MEAIDRKRKLYSMIVGQLRSDGLDKLAKVVADEVLENSTAGPSEKLESLVTLGAQAE